VTAGAADVKAGAFALPPVGRMTGYLGSAQIADVVEACGLPIPDIRLKTQDFC
jgi:hypothetical protein